MKPPQRDPRKSLRMIVAGFIIFIFILLGVFFFLFADIAKRAKEKADKGSRSVPSDTRPSPPTEPEYTPDDRAEAALLERGALEYVRKKNWERLDGYAEGAAGMTREVRTALLDRWKGWNPVEPEEEEMLVALAGVLRGAIRRSGADAELVLNRMSEKLMILMSTDRPFHVRRVAVRAYAAFPPLLVENYLYEGLYLPEADAGIRALLVDILRGWATRILFERVLQLFQASDDPSVCSEAALILSGIQERQPDGDFGLQRDQILVPKLESFEESEPVKKALEALRK